MSAASPSRFGLLRRGLLPFLAVAALLAVGAAAVQEDTNRWLRVESRDLVIGIPMEGDLDAERSVTIGPPALPGVRMWNFKISFLAEDGQEVRQGQPVVGFDTSELRRRLMEEISERDSAEKELEKRATDLEIERRDLELRLAEAEAALRRATFSADVPEDVVAANELKIALIDQRMARMEIEHLQANLEYLDVRERSEIGNLQEKRDRVAAEVEAIQSAIAALTVKAPTDGTVILGKDGDEKLKIGSQVWRAQNVLEIPDLASMQIEAIIAEADAGRLRIGQKATFRLDAYPDHEYSGEVESIRRAVQRKSDTDPEKVVRAVIAVAQTDRERMRPGMRLRGTIEVERFPDTVVVPKDAVFTDAEGAYVQVSSWWSTQEIRPRLGRRNDQYFEVLEGLKPGDAVVALGGEVTR